MGIADIKDRSPNLDTITLLERLLAEARAGELRTLVCVAGSDVDSWQHDWVIDQRSSKRRLVGEVTIMQHEIVNNVALADDGSVIAVAMQRMLE